MNRDFLGGPVVKTAPQVQEMWVPILVGKLRSHTLCMVGSKEEKKMNRVSLTLQRKQLNIFVNNDEI